MLLCNLQQLLMNTWKHWNKVVYGPRYSRTEQVKFFKGCLPQILLGLFLNALTHITIKSLNRRFVRVCRYLVSFWIAGSTEWSYEFCLICLFIRQSVTPLSQDRLFTFCDFFGWILINPKKWWGNFLSKSFVMPKMRLNGGFLAQNKAKNRHV